jgi:DNA-binding transcriptional LysR family regulator
MSNEHGHTNTPNLRELEVLRAMMSTRKTVAAAAMLGITQPAVSRVISALEEKLGLSLFTRSGGRLIPTSDAFILEAEATPIFTALERLSSWPSRMSESGKIKITCVPTIGQYLLPEMVASFKKLFPDVQIVIDITTGSEVIAAVADKRADLGVVDTPARHPSVRDEVFRESVVHVMMKDDDPLTAKQHLSVADIADRPIVALSGRFSARAETERAYAAAGKHFHMGIEVSTIMLAAEMVRAGMGLSLLNPFPISLAGMQGLAARPFSPTISYRTCMLFPTSGGVSALARRFADHLKLTQREDGLTIPIR